MIDLAENEEQSEIARTAARLLAGSASSPSAEVWRRCAELGWLGLAVPEDLGGVGYGLAEQVVLFRELGRARATAPFVAAALAAQVAMADRATERLAAIIEGRDVVELAEPAPTPGQWRIWRAGDAATSLLLVDASGGGRLVDVGQVQTVDVAPTIDPAYELHTVLLSEVAGTAVPSPDGAGLARTGALLVAAMLVGVAEQALALSVRYALDRVQYGRPIGSFQAVKHRCADMAVRAEAAWALTALAAVELAAGRPEATFDTGAASKVAGAAALANARDNIQNHGAIGFTEEHPAHRYLKRAHVLSVQFDGVRACS